MREPSLKRLERRFNKFKRAITEPEKEASSTNSGTAAHTHTQADITGLVSDLVNKADVSHTHPQSDITNLVSDLLGKASTTHSHIISDVTNLQTTLDGKASSSHNHAASEITSGTIDTARLGSGTANSTTYLRGDSTWAPPSASGSITNTSASLSGNVTLAANNTFYDGPSVSLAAGTWLVIFHASFSKTTTTASQVTARITDGTNHYASQNSYHASVSGITLSFAMSAIITLGSTTTIKGQMATTVGNAVCLMRAAVNNNASGNNATTITAIKLA